MEEPEPPLISILCLIAIITLLVVSVFISRRKVEPFNYQPTQQSIVYQWEAPRFYFQTLAMITDKHDLNDRIPACESNGDPKVCNAEFGCSGGMGLWGFVPNTWNETIDRMIEAGEYLPERCIAKFYLPASKERTEAVFDPICNDLAGRWLLKTDGTGHWGYPKDDPRGYIYGFRWGSYDCFMR